MPCRDFFTASKDSKNREGLFSKQLSTAAADPGVSAALRSVGRFDVLSSTPAAALHSRTLYPCPSAPPRYEICSHNDLKVWMNSASLSVSGSILSPIPIPTTIVKAAWPFSCVTGCAQAHKGLGSKAGLWKMAAGMRGALGSRVSALNGE
jgi:hypothetical protein